MDTNETNAAAPETKGLNFVEEIVAKDLAEGKNGNGRGEPRRKTVVGFPA